MKKKRSIRLSPVVTWLLGFLLSGVSMGMALMLQKGSLTETLRYLAQAPVLIVLNWIPMALLLGLLFFAVGNLFYGAGLTTLIWGLLSYVNLVKIEARGDPFVPGDILLLFEGIEAVGSYQLQLHPAKLALLLGLCVLLWFLGRLIESPKPKIPVRLIAVLVCVAVFVGAMAFGYTDDDLYQNLPGPYRANVPAVFEAFGFPYCFLHNFSLYPVDKPEDFSLTEAQTYEETYRHETVLPETAPNMIMVMCEAFTDLPNEDVFSYTDEENPIAGYNALAAADNTISGHMIVSNTGAGTANTEFDVLTGMMTNRIGEGTTSAFRVVHRNTDSVPRMLAENGYETFFMHPGDSWFYNRESVYSYFGITDQVFQEAFTQEDYKGSWITDEAFLRVLRESLAEREGENPMFTYAVTIQNHQAYTEEKYGFLPETVKTGAALSDEASEYLAVYFEGLRDSARMLQDMTAWLQEQEEPYLLVFFGDHQPNLGSDYQAYRELGLYPENLDDAESRLQLYSVPFLIWGNDAFQSQRDLRALSRQLGEDLTISSHYLGALTCQVAGFDGLDGYMDYLNDLREELPVCSVYGYRTADGTWLEELPQDLQEKENLRWHWQYYRLKYQKTDSRDGINDRSEGS